MKNKPHKVFSALAIVFYLMVILSPFVTKSIAVRLGYNPDSMPIEVIVMIACAAVFGVVVIINREWITIVVCIAICIAGTVGMLIWGDEITKGSWFLSAYIFILLIVLALLLNKKIGRQKVFQIVQIIITVLLLANVAANIYVAAEKSLYWFWAISWRRIYFEVVLVANSIASVFLGMWFVTQNKHSDK